VFKLEKNIFVILILLISTNFALAETSAEWLEEGNLLYQHSNYTGAIDAYDKAIALDQYFAIAWCNKGLALSNLARYNEAIEAYNKAIAIDKNYKKPWYNKGNDLDKLGRYEEAIEAYDKAIAIDQNYTDAWYNKGNDLYKLKQYEKAIEAYNKAIAIDPNLAYAWNNKGLAFFELGRYEEAIEAYNKAIAIDKNYAIAWINKGYALANLGRYDEAIEAYNKAIDIDPNNPLPKKNKDIAEKAQKAHETDKPSPIFGILFMLPGIAVVFYGIKELKKAMASKNWSTTVGKVISSEVIRDTSGKRPIYIPKVFYEYSVTGNKYSSNEVSIGHWDSSSPKGAQKIVNRYPTGKDVIVYYDPDNPEDAVLEPGTSIGDYTLILFGAIFIGAGLLIILGN
jgi:tetratricopeptide (TPR) repeat protein